MDVHRPNEQNQRKVDAVWLTIWSARMLERTLIITGVLLATILSVIQSATASGDWEESIVVSPDDVPLPATAPAGARIHGVYSPAVCKFGDGFHMFFGVSIYYRIHHDVCRDSIAHAFSRDGISDWKFVGYVVEPFSDKSIQTEHCDNWPVGTLYQVNDPTVRVQGDKLYIAYTSVMWQYPPELYASGQRETGCIGLATFRIDGQKLSCISRDDQWLVPLRDGPITTCSRPEFLTQEDGQLTLWFDAHGDLCSIPVDSLVSQLDIRSAAKSGLSGALDAFLIRSDSGLLALANGSKCILAARSTDGVKWSTWSEFYRSQATWARDGQGSPCLLRDSSTNRECLYFAGVVMKNAQEYEKITIGVAHRK